MPDIDRNRRGNGERDRIGDVGRKQVEAILKTFRLGPSAPSAKAS